MKKVLAVLFVVLSLSAYAGVLKISDSRLIKAAGVPLYSKAIFVYGNETVGFRFASSESPENAKKWYRKKLPRWSLYDKYGAWILYDGIPGKDAEEVVDMNRVRIQKNDRIPEWHFLDESMTTEITISVPKI